MSELSSEQLAALQALSEGASMTRAAGAAGVNRSALYRWLRNDAPFQAERNRICRAARQAVELRLEGLLEKALDVVERQIDTGDPTASLAILRGSGVLSGRIPAFGPEKAIEVSHIEEIESNELELKRAASRQASLLSSAFGM